MSVFGSNAKSTGERLVAPSKSSPATANLSIVGAGMTIRGDLETDGVVKVEGTVEGHVKATAQVLVARGGVVQGDIETTEAVVGGAVNGAIRARERVEVQAGASVAGDVTTVRLAVVEGATLNGQIKMGDGAWRRDDKPVDLKSVVRTPPAGGAVHPSAAPPA